MKKPSIALMTITLLVLSASLFSSTGKAAGWWSQPTQLTTNAAGDVFPSFSGDGTRIAFTSNRDGNLEIYVMDADGEGQTRLTNNPAFDDESSFSGDGAKIAFMSNRDGNREIYIMDADGTDQTRLTNTPTLRNVDPSFSGDGAKIAFNSERDGNWEIYVMGADGTDQTRLTNEPALDYMPSFSGDGTRIAFVSERDGNAEIYVMGADGTDQTRLTNTPAWEAYPSFSGDGTRIAFTSNRDGNPEIYVMNADGTDQTRLTNEPASDNQPSFSGDGTRLAFMSVRDGDSEIFAVRRDVLAPVTDDNYDGQWYTADFSITLTATDDLSGVTDTYYKINNEESTKKVSTDGQPSIRTEGENNKLEYWSVDGAGNEESHHILAGIKLDKTAPVANAGVDQAVNEGVQVTFDGSVSTDENGIAAYTWAFTDLTPQTLSGRNPTYTFAVPGTYTVTLEVADPAGNTATDTVTITVLDATDPVADAGSDRTVNEDVSTTLNGSGSTDNVGITGYTWTFTDGTVKTLTGDKPAYTFATPGVYTITLNVTDAAGNWATDTVSITVLLVSEAQPFPTWAIAAAIVIVIGIAAGATLLLRKRK